eukprot:TRINITY_DN1799_c0_g1_i2.p2 TRINITY_DN1799_c0_g1~~TRINITY_DN1799_c0_g1_i2.p2  ORF type:complete len:123 (-),score=8.88 TRINITY_DN1799_c0_g1_i2:421-789(-)
MQPQGRRQRGGRQRRRQVHLVRKHQQRRPREVVVLEGVEQLFAHDREAFRVCGIHGQDDRVRLRVVRLPRGTQRRLPRQVPHHKLRILVSNLRWHHPSAAASPILAPTHTDNHETTKPPKHT